MNRKNQYKIERFKNNFSTGLKSFKNAILNDKKFFASAVTGVLLSIGGATITYKTFIEKEKVSEKTDEVLKNYDNNFKKLKSIETIKKGNLLFNIITNNIKGIDYKKLTQELFTEGYNTSTDQKIGDKIFIEKSEVFSTFKFIHGLNEFKIFINNQSKDFIISKKEIKKTKN